MLHGDFEELLRDERRNIHLRQQKIRLKKKNNHNWSRSALQLGQCLFLYLLCAADQYGSKEAQSHPQLVHESLVICDISERQKKECFFRPNTS